MHSTIDPEKHFIQVSTVVCSCLVTTPFAFFGHSMGALLSYELAQHLRGAHSVEPQRLFASGSPAPQFADNREPIYGLPHDIH